MQALTWKEGNVEKESVRGTESVSSLLNAAKRDRANMRRLYFLDGSLPNYKAKNIPVQTPGAACTSDVCWGFEDL